MDREYVMWLLLKDRYYTIDDLRYNQKIGFMLSKEKLDELLKIKSQLIDEGWEVMKPLPLKSFNSKHLFYVNGLYLLSLLNEYMRVLVSDYEMKQSYLFSRNAKDVAVSRLFSEIEGSLCIENVPTTQRRITEIHQKNDLKSENDIIIKNMLDAMNFIIEKKPAFNKQNLRALYDILSRDCLPEEKRLKDGAFYRHDKVYIDIYEGADHHIIDDCMNSLFAFANDSENIRQYDILLPYICHYYTLYIHPYFDYNGRTARMISFWLSYIYDIAGAPLFMSEAINEYKGDYYRAITNTRNTHNDLTYFLGYILENSIKYSFVYKNLEEIKLELSKTGDTLTSAEWNYVKKILVHNPQNYFNHKMFAHYIHSQITKQGAIKILDNLTHYEILKKSKNKRNEVIYKFNPDFITYQYN